MGLTCGLAGSVLVVCGSRGSDGATTLGSGGDDIYGRLPFGVEESGPGEAEAGEGWWSLGTGDILGE